MGVRNIGLLVGSGIESNLTWLPAVLERQVDNVTDFIRLCILDEREVLKKNEEDSHIMTMKKDQFGPFPSLS